MHPAQLDTNMNNFKTFQEYAVLREAVDDIVVGDIVIPRGELDIRFDRSGGPGGQNVNKLATKATLKWNVTHSPALIRHEDVRERFIQLFPNRINREGEVVLQAQRERNQRQNLYACITKLGEMLAQAAQTPTERIETKPTRGALERRQREKDIMRQKKVARSGSWSKDWS
jgi:ribosome-associated protein